MVVQGGTFYNDAVLRSFEKISGGNAIRPDIAGIMGAFGAALIARERYQSHPQETSCFPLDKIIGLTYTTSMSRCRGCINHLRSYHQPLRGRPSVYFRQTACERGLGVERQNGIFPTLYTYKYHRLFDYEPLSADLQCAAPSGSPGC